MYSSKDVKEAQRKDVPHAQMDVSVAEARSSSGTCESPLAPEFPVGSGAFCVEELVLAVPLRSRELARRNCR
jgi:hypothetical protein